MYYPVNTVGVESEVDDQVLKIVHPNTKTANLEEIKNKCKRKPEKRTAPIDTEAMKSVANKYTNQLTKNLHLQIIKVGD